MFKKYRELSDDEIVFLYKNQSDDDLELELLNRYKCHTRKLAGELYRKFKFLYQVEYEDIHCIVTSCLFISINSFKKGMKNFYKYWKSCAIREVYDYVGQFSSLEGDKASIFPTSSNGEERNYFRVLKQNESSLIENYSIISDIAQVIEKDNTNFDVMDKEVFYLFLEGYSLYEIALTLNMKYSTVRRRISKIKKKIGDILFNQ